MATPQETVESDLRAALKAGDKEKLATLRLLLADVKNERIRRGSKVDTKTFAGLVRKAIKQRGEAAEQFRAGGRLELAEKEEREAAILEAYLPQQAGEAVDGGVVGGGAEAGEHGLYHWADSLRSG